MVSGGLELSGLVWGVRMYFGSWRIGLGGQVLAHAMVSLPCLGLGQMLMPWCGAGMTGRQMGRRMGRLRALARARQWV